MRLCVTYSPTQKPSSDPLGRLQRAAVESKAGSERWQEVMAVEVAVAWSLSYAGTILHA